MLCAADARRSVTSSISLCRSGETRPTCTHECCGQGCNASAMRRPMWQHHPHMLLHACLLGFQDRTMHKNRFFFLCFSYVVHSTATRLQLEVDARAFQSIRDFPQQSLAAHWGTISYVQTVDTATDGCTLAQRRRRLVIASQHEHHFFYVGYVAFVRGGAYSYF